MHRGSACPHRHFWADYFDQQGIQYAFFSAANAAVLQQARREALDQNSEHSHTDGTSVRLMKGASSSQAGDGEEGEGEHEASEPPHSDESSVEEEIGESIELEDDSTDDQDTRIRVLSVPELEDLFEKVAPDLTSKPPLLSSDVILTWKRKHLPIPLEIRPRKW
jgi:large subunit GTPase 1